MAAVKTQETENINKNSDVKNEEVIPDNDNQTETLKSKKKKKKKSKAGNYLI